MKEECGVCAVYGDKDAANLCYLGLYSLQHRGQESAGIVSRDRRQFFVVKGMGLVSEVFEPKNINYLKGNLRRPIIFALRMLWTKSASQWTCLDDLYP